MPFSLERLETRLLLAGNVHQFGGTLIVNGTSGSDDIEVIGRGADRVEVFFVDGGDLQSCGVFEGINNVIVRGKGAEDFGEDNIFIEDLDLSGFLTVNAGKTGANGMTLEIDGAQLGGDLTIRGGDDIDTIMLEDLSVDDLRIKTGKGDDTVQFDGTLNTIEGSLNILTGKGADEVYLIFSEVAGPTLISTGQGNDELIIGFSQLESPGLILTGAGDDYVDLSTEAIFNSPLFVSGGSHDQGDLFRDGPTIPNVYAFGFEGVG